MKNLTFKIFLMCVFSLSVNNAFTQTETDSLDHEQVVIIKMKNGEIYKGQIVTKNSEVVVLKTENGEMSLTASKVVSLEKSNYHGKFEFANPHDTRYFFGPTGIPLRKGKGYYQNILVTTNFVNYGITENVSVGGGFEFISTVLGRPIWFLSPKVGFSASEKIHVAGGVIMASYSGEGTASLGYGVVTLGDSETNISLGVGYGFTDGELTDNPAIMLSGTHRVSRPISILSENYVIPTSSENVGYFGIHGIRIMSRKNSFDIGAIVIPEIANDIPALPFVGYARVF